MKVFGVFATLLLFAAGAYAAWPWLAAMSEQNLTRSKTFEKQVSVAENLVLHLEGKPAMGFSWRLDRDRSEGLDLVTVKELGWSFAARRGSASFTKPGILRYLVVGKRSGKPASCSSIAEGSKTPRHPPTGLMWSTFSASDPSGLRAGKLSVPNQPWPV